VFKEIWGLPVGRQFQKFAWASPDEGTIADPVFPRKGGGKAKLSLGLARKLLRARWESLGG
jgi:hypothetical protein